MLVDISDKGVWSTKDMTCLDELRYMVHDGLYPKQGIGNFTTVTVSLI